MQVQYRLAMLSDGRGGSWFYDTSGLTKLLAKARTPVYRLPSPEVFNRLIGTDHGAPAR
jgi:hypothetical protein